MAARLAMLLYWSWVWLVPAVSAAKTILLVTTRTAGMLQQRQQRQQHHHAPLLFCSSSSNVSGSRRRQEGQQQQRRQQQRKSFGHRRPVMTTTTTTTTPRTTTTTSTELWSAMRNCLRSWQGQVVMVAPDDDDDDTVARTVAAPAWATTTEMNHRHYDRHHFEKSAQPQLLKEKRSRWPPAADTPSAADVYFSTRMMIMLEEPEYVTVRPCSPDLQSARDWLLQLPEGAYTAMRCDYYVRRPPTTKASLDHHGTHKNEQQQQTQQTQERPSRAGHGNNNNNNINNNYGPVGGGWWDVWGQDYHWGRLEESYRIWAQQQLQPITQEPRQNWPGGLLSPAAAAARAVACSTLLGWLLLKAQEEEEEETAQDHHHDSSGQEEPVGVPFQIYMATFLWYHDHVSSSSSCSTARTTASDETATTPTVAAASCRPIMTICGHIRPIVGSPAASSSSGRPVSVVLATSMPSPSSSRRDRDDVPWSSYFSSEWPNRQPHPQAKLSVWCRQRQPLEEQFLRLAAATAAGIREVILVCEEKGQEPSSSNHSQAAGAAVDQEEGQDRPHVVTTASASFPEVMLLEGLTTNVFVEYPNRVLRTAPSSSVLSGYARHLVMEAVQPQTMGYTVDEETLIRVRDAPHLWKQVFLTSSIQLVTPVAKVYCVDVGANNQHTLRQLWPVENKVDGWNNRIGGSDQKTGSQEVDGDVGSSVLHTTRSAGPSLLSSSVLDLSALLHEIRTHRHPDRWWVGRETK